MWAVGEGEKTDFFKYYTMQALDYAIYVLYAFICISVLYNIHKYAYYIYLYIMISPFIIFTHI